MPLINSEINLISTWSSTCVINSSTGKGTFAINDTNVPVVTLSTQAKANPLEQLKSGFKKLLAKTSIGRQNPYLDYLIYPSFQAVNRLFVLLFEDDAIRIAHTGYFLPKVKIKGCNVMIDEQNFFDQLIKMI